MFATSFPERIRRRIRRSINTNVYTFRKYYMAGPAAQRNLRFPSQGECQPTQKFVVALNVMMHFIRVGIVRFLHFIYYMFMNKKFNTRPSHKQRID